jgi:predicted transposase/invertase (TIGR01784 family)
MREVKEKKPPLSLKNDYVFRSVMGRPDSRAELADFLKSALDLPEDDYEELTVIDPHLLAWKADDKESILDVRIRTKTGKQVDVEVQLFTKLSFRERIVYYNARMYADQLLTGQDYRRLGRAISVVVTDFEVVHEDENYFHRFTLYDSQSRIQFSDAQEICLLELPKLPDKSDGTALWRWLRFMKTEEVEEMEKLAEQNSYIEKTMMKVMEMSKDEAERMIAEGREKARRDREAELDYAMNEGLALGEAKGEAEGEVKKQLEIARNMKGRGMDVALISELTGLPEAEIRTL